MFKKRSRPVNTREKSDSPLVVKTTPNDAEVQDMTEAAEEEPTETIQDLLLMRKYGKQQAGIDLLKLNEGEKRKKKKKSKAEEEADTEGQFGLQQKGKKPVAEEEDENSDEESKTRRLVRTNNFTQQTNALDVDKHMMAYIDAELAKRRGQKSNEEDISVEAEYDPQEELYRIAEKYRTEKKKAVDEEEGNVTTSMGMLTSIPEVDLGMDMRLKNMMETEKAKREMMEARKANAGKKKEEDESFAAARFYRPNHRIQSDADALEDARREALNLPPVDRRSRETHDTATDEMVYERFKKRIRKN